MEVPEVAERIIEIKAMSREAGYRTKVAVTSIDSKVDAVGACVGVRGSRIKNIVEELGGEKIDIVRWNESSQILIANSLKPAEIQDTALCFEMGRATVVVPEDQLSLAIGKRGQNVRLAARLTGWDIDILTPKEYNRGMDRLAAALRKVEGVDEKTAERVLLLGLISVMDVEEVGPAPLIKELEMVQELAERIVQACKNEAKLVREELVVEKSAAAQALAMQAAAKLISEAAKPEGEGLEAVKPDGEGLELAILGGEGLKAVNQDDENLEPVPGDGEAVRDAETGSEAAPNDELAPVAGPTEARSAS